MFPIRDHNPSDRTPFVTYGLIALNIGIFLSYASLFADPGALNAFFFNWGLVPVSVDAFGILHGFLTYMFLHGGLMHLGSNMLFLWIFGDNLEDEMGHVGFLLFYLAAGIGSGVVHYLSDPVSQVPTVGASGAVAGVMGGYLLLFPRARVDVLLILIVYFRVFALPAWVMLGIWFGIQLASGVLVDSSMGGVAYWAHAGGFVIGLGLTGPLFLRRGGSRYWARTEGHPPHPEAKYRVARTGIPTVRRRK